MQFFIISYIQTLSHSRRQSKESMTKLEKGLHSIHKYNDSTMNQQMKKILQSQTKINNRIQGECAKFLSHGYSL